MTHSKRPGPGGRRIRTAKGPYGSDRWWLEFASLSSWASFHRYHFHNCMSQVRVWPVPQSQEQHTPSPELPDDADLWQLLHEVILGIAKGFGEDFLQLVLAALDQRGNTPMAHALVFDALREMGYWPTHWPQSEQERWAPMLDPTWQPWWISSVTIKANRIYQARQWQRLQQVRADEDNVIRIYPQAGI